MMSSRASKLVSSSLLAASKLLLKSSSSAPPLQTTALVGSMVPKVQGNDYYLEYVWINFSINIFKRKS